MTISISSAPSPTARRTSSSFVRSGYCPLGKPVATDATCTAEFSPRNFRAYFTMFGYTQTAAQLGTPYFASAGCNALRQRYATLPGVSLPSSVVRSIMLTAIFKPASLALVLMLRLVKAAARSSAITASTVGTERRRRSRAEGRGEKGAAADFVTAAFIQGRI